MSKAVRDLVGKGVTLMWVGQVVFYDVITRSS